MKHPQIEAIIEARAGNRVALTFRNTTDRDAYLYRPNACEGGRIENNVFRIRDSTAQVRYTGIYVKRPAPRREDFAVLAGRASRTEEIDLAAAYALSSGVQYAVTYEAFHDNPDNPEELWIVTSNTATLKEGTQ